MSAMVSFAPGDPENGDLSPAMPTIPTIPSSSAIHVLSDKVNRALHVRTDTPAMRAALDALANLPSEEDRRRKDAGAGVGATAGGGGIIDAKSVRAAIERDALRRALQFQEELRRLADDASALRVRVEAVGRAARAVGSRVESPAVGHAAASVLVVGDGGFGVGGEEANAANDTAGSSPYKNRTVAHAANLSGEGAEAAWEEERSLAARLHGAHRALLDTSSRRVAVEAFLDKFDLGDSEARLLDHYNFEGFVDGVGGGNASGGEEGGGAQGHQNAWGGSGGMEDASAFLNALERLVVIRSELSKTFGGRSGEAEALIAIERAESEDDAYGSGVDGGGGGGRLGANSALRMMEQLASRQERAHERLYQFAQLFLGVGYASAAAHAPTSSSDTRVLGGHGQSHSFHRPGVAPGVGAGPLGRFRDGDEMDEAHGHPLIRRSLHVLRHSPARRAHALELVASARRTEVTRRFLLALTSGYDGAPAMEVRAHDPRAYVGDMLAFAFRAFRVEGELVQTLLLWKEGRNVDGNDDDGVGAKEGAEKLTDGKREGRENGSGESEGGSYEDVDTDEDDELVEKPMTPAEVLAQSMGGLARPLRSRISQVVDSLATRGGDGFGAGGTGTGVDGTSSFEGVLGGANDDEDNDDDRLAALYSVCGLLRFYCSAVRKALGKMDANVTGAGVEAKNPFLSTCEESLDEASAAYAASLRAYGAMLERHASASGVAGLPSSPETEALLAQRVVVRISEERSASPGFVEDFAADSTQVSYLSLPPSSTDAPTERLSLTFLVNIMINAALPYLWTLDDSAALRAALAAAHKAGLGAADVELWTATIAEKEKILAEALVDSETNRVLDACGLGPLRSAAERMDGAYVDGMIMASHPGLSQAEVDAAMKSFYSSLFSPPLPTYETVIKDSALRKYARAKTAQNVADAYRNLYEAITSEKGGYDDLAFLGHDPGQVKTLLSL